MPQAPDVESPGSRRMSASPLEKAFGGEATYDFSHENRVARVTWHRD